MEQATDGHRVYMEGSSMESALFHCKRMGIPTRKDEHDNWYVHTETFYEKTGYTKPIRIRKELQENHFSELGNCYHYFRMSDSLNDPNIMCRKCCTMMPVDQDHK